jgi:mitochondrial fission protein ELM1
VTPVFKRVRVQRPWRLLPPILWPDPLTRLEPGGDPLEPPWPDVVIGTGRQAAPLSLALRRASGGRSFTVQMQNPTLPPERFDVVVASEHDKLRGNNVIVVLGSMHRVTKRLLAEAAERYRGRYAALARPLVAVLIGGSNGRYRLGPATARAIGAALRALADKGSGIALTFSRRTGAENEAQIRNALAGSGADVWDGSGDNPYLGMLGLADALLVTADSVNMVSEALATGKPVHVIELPGRPGKFRDFHRSLFERGLTRPFRGRIEAWSYVPPAETERAAREVLRRLEQHRERLRPQPD